MRRFSRSLALVAVMLGLVTPQVSAAPIGVVEGEPRGSLTVDGQTYEIPLVFNDRGWMIGDAKLPSGQTGWVLETPGFKAEFTGFLDPDPSIAYGLAVTDFGAPSTFGFSFLTPIVPVGSPNTVSASIVGGLTDFTGDGVSLTPTGAFTQTASAGMPLTSMGVDVGTAFAAGPGAPGAFYVYGPFGAGPAPGPGPGPWTFLGVTASFTLSGGGDIAALTGFASIDDTGVPTIPEPATLTLLATGLAGAVVRRQARRRRDAAGTPR